MLYVAPLPWFCQGRVRGSIGRELRGLADPGHKALTRSAHQGREGYGQAPPLGVRLGGP